MKLNYNNVSNITAILKYIVVTVFINQNCLKINYYFEYTLLIFD